jgi:hypothetical protein
MEPRFRGSASSVEAARGSSPSSTPGAVAVLSVWQGSGRSRPWSRSRSPAKQAPSIMSNESRQRTYVDQEREAGRRLAPRPLKLAERPFMHCYWLR